MRLTKLKKLKAYVAEHPAAYLEEIKDVPPEKIAYVDECGIHTYLYREYGYALPSLPSTKSLPKKPSTPCAAGG